MKQYCRYCGLCCEVDGGYYCNEKEQLMTESEIKRANNCKYYGYTDVGDVITGKQYKPRKSYKRHSKQTPQCEQISLED